MNLASVFLPPANQQTFAENSETTCRIWLDHGNAGNWHSSLNYAVIHYPDGTILGAANTQTCLMTYDNANHRWFLDVPVGGEYVQFFFDVNGNGYSANDKKDVNTGLVTLPAVPCESCVLCTNQYRSNDPVDFTPFVAVPTDNSYIHVDHFEDVLGETTTGPDGQPLTLLCANGGANIPDLLAYYYSLPTYEQDHFLESTVNVYPAPTTMTGAEIINYLIGYQAAHPELAQIIAYRENNQKNKEIGGVMVLLATAITAGFFFISKKQRATL